MSTALSRARLVQLLEQAQGKRVAIIGDAMLDVYLTGDVERISPEAPVPVVRVRERKYALGGAANVAQNVAAIGARCDLVAAVGADQNGDILLQMLGAMGAGVGSLVRVARATTVKTRIVARSQQLVRVDEEDDADLGASDSEQVLAAARAAIADADALVFEDYNKGVLVPAVIRAAIEAGLERSLPIVVDPKFKNFFAYQGATIFKPNRRELEAALGAAVDVDHPDSLPALPSRLGAECVLLTLGEAGMALVTGTSEVRRVPPVAREIYDVVGAGDTVTAYLATMLAAGATVEESAIIANLAAGIEVGKLGAATVTRAELMEFASEHRHVD